MVERDIGSTFMMPQTQLFKADRVSKNIVAPLNRVSRFLKKLHRYESCKI